MSSHYFYRPGNYLSNYFGYQYLAPQYAAWQNYTVPFYTPPGWFYEPHYYYPRNDSQQLPSVVCKNTTDGRFCPLSSNEYHANPSMCQMGDRTISSVSSLAECEFPGTWPVDFNDK